MAKSKNSNEKQRFNGFDGGRVADKKNNTVYSPNQIDQMYQASQKNRKK